MIDFAKMRGGDLLALMRSDLVGEAIRISTLNNVTALPADRLRVAMSLDSAAALIDQIVVAGQTAKKHLPTWVETLVDQARATYATHALNESAPAGGEKDDAE